MNAYILALLANFSFALGTQFFTHYSRKISAIWMNAFKASVAFVGFLLVVILTTGFHEISFNSFLLFYLSGFLALGIGDVFLLSAFSHIGPGRTMILFSFQPVIVGIFSYFLFGQTLDASKLWAIIFFILCLYIFALETLKAQGRWELKGLIFAFLGMFLDGIGILITREAFDSSIQTTSFEGNIYRTLGALTFYFLLSYFKPYQFIQNFKNLNWRSRRTVFFGAFLGTFCSLSFFLMAVQTAHLATLTAISVSSTILASLFECIWHKTLPSKYLVFAFIPFAIGMYLILF
jgi:drug/metabolite transporter (DMT)-like permease